jgi:hypothetical protein
MEAMKIFKNCLVGAARTRLADLEITYCVKSLRFGWLIISEE